MQVLSGASHPQLAKKVAHQLGVKLIQRTIRKYPTGDLYIRLPDNLIGEKVIIVQSLFPPADSYLLEFLFLADAALRCQAQEIIGVIPWLAYSKQDRVFRSGEALPVQVIAKLISALPFTHLFLLDLHNSQTVDFFTVPAQELSFISEFAKQIKSRLTPKSVVIAPDKGGFLRSQKFAQLLHLPLITLDKTRDPDSGEVTIHRASADIAGSDCVLFDDLIATGATVIEISQFLRQNKVHSIIFCATHALFSLGWEPFLNSDVGEIWISDSIPLSSKIPQNKIKVISTVDVIVKALKSLS